MKRRILTAEEQERIRASRVPDERRIIVIMGDITVTAESSIPKIPRDKNDSMYAVAAREFFNFYSSVVKIMNTIPEITIVRKGNSSSPGSVSQYIRFTIEDPVTGSPVHYMFELRVSDHVLPEDWEQTSFDILMEIIEEYEAETGDHLEPKQYDFVVGYDKDNIPTHVSYDEALREVEEKLKEIVAENTK